MTLTWFFAPATGRCHVQSAADPQRTRCGSRIGAQWKTVTPEWAAGNPCARCLQLPIEGAPTPPVEPSPPATTWYTLAGTPAHLRGLLHQRDPQHPTQARCGRSLARLRPATPAEISAFKRCSLCVNAMRQTSQAGAAQPGTKGPRPPRSWRQGKGRRR